MSNYIYEHNSKFNQTNKDLLEDYFKDLTTIKEKIKTNKNSK